MKANARECSAAELSPGRELKSAGFKWFRAVADLNANREEKAVLWALAYHADKDGEVRAGETRLCREIGLAADGVKHPDRTLRRWLRRLERKGWIETKRNAHPVDLNGRRFFLNVYRLTIPTRADSIVSAHEADGRTTGVATGGHSCVRETARELLVKRRT